MDDTKSQSHQVVEGFDLEEGKKVVDGNVSRDVFPFDTGRALGLVAFQILSLYPN
jgi:hypothetical protein